MVTELIQQFNRLTEEESNKIIQSIENQCAWESELFDDPIVFGVEDGRPASLKGRKGIYIFMVTDDIELSREQVSLWNRIPGAPIEWVEDKLALKGTCLYLGSSTSNSLYVRLGDHFKGDGTKTSLNLNHPGREIFKDSVEIYAFPVKKTYKENLEWIVKAIEMLLHEKMSPLTGKKM